ncbi:MAG: hypothetical protein Q9168_000865 [Polycauliona sp. 1 TL-2023]
MPTAAVSSKKVSLEGVVSLLRIHEFNIQAVDVEHEGTLQWPCPDGEEMENRIDGTVVIYSISDAGSTKMIPSFLQTPKVGSRPNRPRALTDVNSRTSANRSKHQRVQSDYPNKPSQADLPVAINEELHEYWQSVSPSASQESQFSSSSIHVHHVNAAAGSPEHESGHPKRPDVALAQGRDDVDECEPDLQQEQSLTLFGEAIRKNDDVAESDETSKNAGVGFDEIFSVVTKEIMLYLEVACEDDDTAWACSDVILSRTDTVPRPPSVSSIQSALSIPNAGSSIQKNVSRESESPAHAPERKSATSSIASSAGKSSAVVAGINGTAVHRLYLTREMVPHHVQKQFMRLEILMGTQKSHFAYRLAWSNTSTERIPFLPLHSRDLASAEEGNPTYIGEGCERINWKKFEVIGEVVVSMQRRQATSYSNISRNEEVQRLILDSKFTKDDDVSLRVLQSPNSRDGLLWKLHSQSSE